MSKRVAKRYWFPSLILHFCGQSEENSWLKVDYLMDLSEWLFQQDFPLPVCLAQLHMVVQILLTKHEPVSVPGMTLIPTVSYYTLDSVMIVCCRKE